MARNFDGKNTDSSLRMFFNRANYNLNSFSDLSINTEHITDFSLGELRLYGRISHNQSLVVPQKSAITKFKGFWSKSSTLKAINFVSDAADAMSRQLIKQTLTSGKVKKNNSDTVSLALEKGYTDPFVNYETYVSQINEIFINKLYSSKRIIKINDFNSFFDNVAPFILSFAANSPYSFSAYHKSVQQDPMSCGLCVQFSPIDLSLDQTKEDTFLSDPNYPLIVEMARQYGFLIDKNAPNRLYADLASPIMLRYASAYGINSTEDVFRTSFRTINISNYELVFERIINMYKMLSKRKEDLPFKTKSQLLEESRTSNRPRFLRFYLLLRRNEEQYNQISERDFNIKLQQAKTNLDLNSFLSTFEREIKSLTANPYGLSALARKNGR